MGLLPDAGGVAVALWRETFLDDLTQMTKATRARSTLQFKQEALKLQARPHVWQNNTAMAVPRLVYVAARMTEKLAVCRVMRPFATTKVSVPNSTREAADSHAHSTYATSS